MNNDLISREVLKEVINYNQMYVNPKLVVDDVIKLIDNAPTVEDRTDEVLSLQNTIAKLVEGIAENTKPQGKWIFHKDYNESCRYGCNQCGNLTNVPSNFCPNCGAEMQKFANKT